MIVRWLVPSRLRSVITSVLPTPLHSINVVSMQYGME